MRRLRHINALWLFLLVASAVPAAAQDGPRASRTLMNRYALGGALLGASVGALAGGFIGGSLSSRGCESGNPDACLGAAFPGFIIGFSAGHTIGAPAGAHLANGRRGNLARSLLVSGAVFAAEVLAIDALVDDGRTRHEGTVIAIAIAAPVIQVVSSAIIEHRTAP